MSESKVKTLLIRFFHYKGTVQWESVPPCQTTNQVYVQILECVRQWVRRVRPHLFIDKWILHFEKTPFHATFSVKEFWQKNLSWFWTAQLAHQISSRVPSSSSLSWRIASRAHILKPRKRFRRLRRPFWTTCGRIAFVSGPKVWHYAGINVYWQDGTILKETTALQNKLQYSAVSLFVRLHVFNNIWLHSNNLWVWNIKVDQAIQHLHRNNDIWIVD
jgi:hypothetical protein